MRAPSSRIAGKRRVRDGFVELRPLLAGEIAGSGLVRAEFGLDGRDEAPAIGGQAHREIVEVEGLGEKHVLDRGRIVARRRSGVGAGAVEKLVVVLLEFGGRPSSARRSVAACHVRRRRRPRWRGTRRAATALSACSPAKAAPVVLLRAHHLLQQHVGRHRHGGDDQQRHPVCALDEKISRSAPTIGGCCDIYYPKPAV